MIRPNMFRPSANTAQEKRCWNISPSCSVQFQSLSVPESALAYLAACPLQNRTFSTGPSSAHQYQYRPQTEGHRQDGAFPPLHASALSGSCSTGPCTRFGAWSRTCLDRSTPWKESQLSEITLCKILKHWEEMLDSYRLNGVTTGFHLQTRKLEPSCTA